MELYKCESQSDGSVETKFHRLTALIPNYFRGCDCIEPIAVLPDYKNAEKIIEYFHELNRPPQTGQWRGLKRIKQVVHENGATEMREYVEYHLEPEIDLELMQKMDNLFAEKKLTKELRRFNEYLGLAKTNPYWKMRNGDEESLKERWWRQIKKIGRKKEKADSIAKISKADIEFNDLLFVNEEMGLLAIQAYVKKYAQKHGGMVEIDELWNQSRERWQINNSF